MKTTYLPKKWTKCTKLPKSSKNDKTNEIDKIDEIDEIVKNRRKRHNWRKHHKSPKTHKNSTELTTFGTCWEVLRTIFNGKIVPMRRHFCMKNSLTKLSTTHDLCEIEYGVRDMIEIKPIKFCTLLNYLDSVKRRR